MKNIPTHIQEMDTNTLIEAINQLDNVTWEEDALLRRIAKIVHGEDDVMHMIMLASPMARELANRVVSNAL